MEILTPGGFINRIFNEIPDVVAGAISHIADRWTKPSRTTDEIIDLLAAHPSMADANRDPCRGYLQELSRRGLPSCPRPILRSGDIDHRAEPMSIGLVDHPCRGVAEKVGDPLVGDADVGEQ